MISKKNCLTLSQDDSYPISSNETNEKKDIWKAKTDNEKNEDENKNQTQADKTKSQKTDVKLKYNSSQSPVFQDSEGKRKIRYI